ncbi:MAG: hypothetical protein WCH83_00215 [Alphaproteobacteria bacterium]
MRAGALIVVGLMASPPAWAQQRPAAQAPAPANAQPPAVPQRAQPAQQAQDAPRPIAGEVAASTAGGFARMIYSFPEVVGAEAKVSGGVLVISFRKPVQIDLAQLGVQLGAYVTAIRRDPDGASIRFALSQRLTVNTMEAGERVLVDLLPESWRGQPPGLPGDIVEDLVRRARDAERRAKLAEVQRTARLLPPVTVRVGNHPTFSRFVFSLPEAADISLDRRGDRLTIKINKPFNADLRQAKGGLPIFVPDILAETTSEDLAVHLAMPASADVRAFREDNTYVVDVSIKSDQPVRSTSASASAPPSDVGVTSLPGASSVAPAAVPVPQRRAEAAPSRTATAAPVAPATTPARTPVQSRPAIVEAPAEAARAPQPAVRAEAPAGAEGAAEPTPAPSATPPLPPAPAAAAAAPAPAPAANAAPARSGPVSLQVRQAGDTIRILAPFNRDIPGAVFQRGDTLWLVFDAGETIDLASLQSDGAGIFSSVDATRSNTGTAVRLGLDRQRLASASRDGTAWIVTLAETVLEPPRPLTLSRQRTPDGALTVAVPFADAGSIHRLTDPLAGDELVVVTGMGPARSFVRGMDFVEFALLGGSHGIVVQPLADDVMVTYAAETVSIGRPRGLTVTQTSAQSQAAPRTSRRARLVNFDQELWSVDENAPFLTRESDLIAHAAAVHETQRTAARLALVRFYMARQRWPEAKAIVDLIMRQDRRVTEDGSMNGLRGILQALLRRPTEALRDLSHPAVGAAPDASRWRALALTVDGRFRDAHEAFEQAGGVGQDLPPPLARELLSAAATAALEVGAIPVALRHAAEIEEIGIPEDHEQAHALLRGRISEAEGQAKEALRSYARAINGPDLITRAEGEQRQLALRQRIGEVPIKDAIEALSTMSLGWRGDATEARTLALLARLQGNDGKFRDAFTTLRGAMRAYPRDESVRAAQDELARRFEDLFTAGQADAMSPVDALALYYDFRELTPPGRRGDEMIRRLADRLVAVDLLDQAASLLQHQVERRLTGAARAQVAARLAVIQLMNRKPSLAMQTLRSTRIADLPEELRQQRYLLEARALADNNMPNQALELLGEVTSKESDLAKADILWSAQRFKESSELVERMLSTRRNGSPLSEDERRQVLRSAIGYALSDDTLAQERLRTRFRALMSGTPDARSFDVLTAPIETRGVEYREIARSIADLDTLQSFLKSYRERYPTETPGATPNASVPSARGAT